MSIDLTNTNRLGGFLRRLLLDHYDLSLFSILGSYGYFDHRRVVLAYTGLGNMAFKLAHKAYFNPSAIHTLRYLADRLYPNMPALIPSATGRDFVEDAGVIAYAFEYLPVSPVEPCTPADWELLGRAAGRLNRHQDCPTPFGIPVDAAIQEMNAWVEGQPFADAYRAMTVNMGIIAESGAVGLIHGEINTANAGKRGDGSLALLDWDEAGSGPIALELGYPLITQFLEVDTHAFKEEEAKAFYRGAYQENPVIIDPEILFEAALFHAARYLRFADVERRWKRLVFAVEQKQMLLDAALPKN